MSILRKVFTIAAFLAAMLGVCCLAVLGNGPPPIPERYYTLWGTAYVDNVALTRDDTGYTISLQVNDEELVSYAMGALSIDWYVLMIPMSVGEQQPDTAQTGDTAYIYINGVLITEAYLKPDHHPVSLPANIGNPAETAEVSIYTQIAPAAIDDLAASTGTGNGEVDLTWTAPGDNGNLGTVAGYIVKYSQDTITDQTEFDNAITFPQSWIPKPSGETENHTVTGLIVGEIYYFAVEAVDSVPLQGAMSNSPVSAMAMDRTPPYVIGHDPAPDSTAPIDTNISVEVRDDGVGVDQSTIQMTVEGIPVVPDITPITNGYLLIYDPPSDLAYGQEMNITVYADDLATPPNQMDGPHSYSFQIFGNTPPVASDAIISPSSPLTGDDLVASYGYSDVDGDPESGTTIRWYKNSNIKPAYNDLKEVPSTATKKGEDWRFTVRPGDGKELGGYLTSPTVTIGNTPPVADAGGPYEVRSGEEIIFDGSSSFDIDGDLLTTYSWDFGDDSAGTGVSPTHTYSDDGVYAVKLVVNDGTVDSSASITTAYMGPEPGGSQQTAIELVAGWNFFSIPTEPEDTRPDVVLDSIRGKYDSILGYDAVLEEWLAYTVDVAPFLNNLDKVVPGRGYWIKMNQPGILVFQGVRPATAILLRAGRNLVGYNSQAFSKPIAECMESIEGQYNSVWTYDSYLDKWPRYIPDGPSSMNDMEFMQSGKGYLIDAKEECLWDIGQ